MINTIKRKETPDLSRIVRGNVPMRKVRYERRIYDEITETEQTEFREGLFHQWAQYRNGDEMYPVGIIEESDGQVVMVSADLIKFLDRQEK